MRKFMLATLLALTALGTASVTSADAQIFRRGRGYRGGYGNSYYSTPYYNNYSYSTPYYGSSYNNSYYYNPSTSYYRTPYNYGSYSYTTPYYNNYYYSTPSYTNYFRGGWRGW